jgi:hypothetical protein
MKGRTRYKKQAYGSRMPQLTNNRLTFRNVHMVFLAAAGVSESSPLSR